MSSQVNRNGNMARPSWRHPSGNNVTNADLQLEMMESVRNVLEDVRTELQRINSTLQCRDFQAIPHRLKRISRNTFVAKNKKEPKKGNL